MDREAELKEYWAESQENGAFIQLWQLTLCACLCVCVCTYMVCGTCVVCVVCVVHGGLCAVCGTWGDCMLCVWCLCGTCVVCVVREGVV